MGRGLRSKLSTLQGLEKSLELGILTNFLEDFIVYNYSIQKANNYYATYLTEHPLHCCIEQDNPGRNEEEKKEGRLSAATLELVLSCFCKELILNPKIKVHAIELIVDFKPNAIEVLENQVTPAYKLESTVQLL